MLKSDHSRARGGPVATGPQALRESEELFRGLSVSCPVGIYRADLAGNVTYANPKCQEILQLPADAMRNHGWMQRVHPEDAESLLNNWLTANKRGEDYEQQYRLLFGDGTIRWAHGRSAVIFDDQRKPCGTVGTVTDITERKQLEDQLRAAKNVAEHADRSKDLLLANVSHELRTPLNGILGMAALLLDSPLNAEQRECAQMILASGDALVSVVNNILDLSGAATGRLDIQTAPFNLRSLVDQAIAVVHPMAAQKQLRVYSDYSGQALSRFVGDERRIRQILLNYLMNAVKFTTTGHVSLAVAVDSFEDQRAMIRFSVHDTGIGISEDDQAMLFHPFTQIDSSSSRRYGGAGLGLALSRRLAQLMGGTVGVVSESGRGSEFWLRLPLAIVAS